MKEDKPVPLKPAPDTEILTELANQPIEPDAPPEPEFIEKPQLGPVVLGGKRSYRRQIAKLLLIVILLAIGAVLGYTYAQDKAASSPAAPQSQH